MDFDAICPRCSDPGWLSDFVEVVRTINKLQYQIIRCCAWCATQSFCLPAKQYGVHGEVFDLSDTDDVDYGVFTEAGIDVVRIPHDQAGQWGHCADCQTIMVWRERPGHGIRWIDLEPDVELPGERCLPVCYL